MLKAKLIIVGAKTKVTEVDLRLPATIGRGREATLTVKHPLVSRAHCKVTELNGELVVQDLGSLNGTYISNEQLEPHEQYILPPDELLTVGGVTFRAVYETPSGDPNSDSTHTGNLMEWTPVPDDTCDESSPTASDVASIRPPQVPGFEQSGEEPQQARPASIASPAAEGNSLGAADSESADKLFLPPAALPPACDDRAETLPVEQNDDH